MIYTMLSKILNVVELVGRGFIAAAAAGLLLLIIGGVIFSIIVVILNAFGML